MVNPIETMTRDKLRRRVRGYFVARGDGHVSVAGLALALGVRRRDVLAYASASPNYDIVSSALARIEAHIVDLVCSGRAATGVVYLLRHDFGWEVPLSDAVGGSDSVQAWLDATMVMPDEVEIFYRNRIE